MRWASEVERDMWIPLSSYHFPSDSFHLIQVCRGDRWTVLAVRATVQYMQRPANRVCADSGKFGRSLDESGGLSRLARATGNGHHLQHRGRFRTYTGVAGARGIATRRRRLPEVIRWA